VLDIADFVESSIYWFRIAKIIHQGLHKELTDEENNHHQQSPITLLCSMLSHMLDLFIFSIVILSLVIYKEG